MVALMARFNEAFGSNLLSVVPSTIPWALRRYTQGERLR
jgi:hypothetical protein